MPPSSNQRRFISVADEYVQLLVDASPLPSIGFDTAGNIIAWNDTAGGLLGWAKDGSAGGRRAHVSRARVESTYQGLRDAPCQPRHLRFELRGIRFGGSPYLISVSVGQLYNNTAEALGALGVLVELPTPGRPSPLPPPRADPVLVGRRDLMMRLESAVAQAKAGAPSSLLLFDIEHLDAIVSELDAFGRARVAARFVRVLKKEVAVPSALAVLGADRYALVLPGAGDEAAAAVATRVRRAVARFCHVAAGRVSCTTASVGICRIDDSRANAASVLTSAEAALADATRQGGDRVVASPACGAEARRMRRWSARVEEAIDRGQLRLSFQPVINLETGATHHLRASSHVRAEDGSFVPVEDFVPLLGQCRLAQTIDRWAVQEAIRFLGAQPSGSVHIPVSDSSLSDPLTRSFIEEEVARGGAAAVRLGIEVNEGAAIADVPTMKHWMSRVASRGCRLSLAGVGVTRAPLVVLRELPVSYVVIGRPLTSGIGRDRTVRALVRSLVSASLVAAKEVIAASADSEADIRYFKQMRVKYVQCPGTEPPGSGGMLTQRTGKRSAA